jgi:squalene-associated FAD-dependent desaturase
MSTNQAFEQSKLNIAVIGAGWAGLAAAVTLKDLGAHVTVFEAAPVTGGRARGVDDIHMGGIDNGQHLMLGAYAETLTLIKRLQPLKSINQLVLREPLYLESADGAFRLRAPTLPAPFNTLMALVCAKGLSPADRFKALGMMVRCRLSGWRARPHETVSALLLRHQQTEPLCLRLWMPLCLAALNTPIQQSCAQLFLNVLRDCLNGPRHASDCLIPRVDLTTLWPAAAAQHLTMRYRHIVREVRATDTGVKVDGVHFDACVVATPPYAAARILFDLPGRVDSFPQPVQTPLQQSEASLLRILRAFDYGAIATLALELENEWRLPRNMMMLDEDPTRGHVGQWVFNRLGHGKQLAVVISDASDFLKHDRERFVDAIATQIREQSARHRDTLKPMPAVKYQRLIVEKRATFDAVPGLARPSNRSPWSRIALAGDWTDTGYPAVLEGAVRSGLGAAAVLKKTFNL